MASVAGIISQHAKLDIDSTGQLRKMLRLMRHRGPDNSVVRTLYDDRGAVGAYEFNLSARRTHKQHILFQHGMDEIIFLFYLHHEFYYRS
jgi:asparagine synthetase B (glutamine-hydrolysing)